MRWILLCLLALSACSRVRYIALADTNREEPVDVVVTRPPHCPYREIGLLKARTHNLEKALPALRNEARALGANTVWVRSEPGAKVEGLALLVRCRAPATE